MDIKSCVNIEDLVKEYAERKGVEHFEAWKEFEEAYLVPEGSKPACFGKYTVNKKKSIECFAP